MLMGECREKPHLGLAVRRLKLGWVSSTLHRLPCPLATPLFHFELEKGGAPSLKAPDPLDQLILQSVLLSAKDICHQQSGERAVLTEHMGRERQAWIWGGGGMSLT